MSKYITVPELDLGAGIDQLSAENRLQPGYSEDLMNCDPTPEGYLTKRTGYQSHAGFLPIRIERVEYLESLTNNLCFYLDSSVDVSSIDLSEIRSSPLVVYGRTSTAHATGDLTNTDSAHYYSEFTANVRKTFLTGTNTMTIPEAEHGGGVFISVGVAESTSVTDYSNSQFLVDSYVVDQLTGD